MKQRIKILVPKFNILERYSLQSNPNEITLWFQNSLVIEIVSECVLYREKKAVQPYIPHIFFCRKQSLLIFLVRSFACRCCRQHYYFITEGKRRVKINSRISQANGFNYRKSGVVFVSVFTCIRVATEREGAKDFELQKNDSCLHYPIFWKSREIVERKLMSVQEVEVVVCGIMQVAFLKA